MMGLAHQRVDLLQRAVGEFHRLAQSDGLESVAKAEQAMDIINSISDAGTDRIGTAGHQRAEFDGEDTPDFSFELGANPLDDERLKARDMLFSEQTLKRAIQSAQSTLERTGPGTFAENPGVPRCFNSYARTRLSTTACSPPKAKEQVLILRQPGLTCIWSLPTCSPKLKGVDAALPHLNAMVRYAPAYPLSHHARPCPLGVPKDFVSGTSRHASTR